MSEFDKVLSQYSINPSIDDPSKDLANKLQSKKDSLFGKETIPYMGSYDGDGIFNPLNALPDAKGNSRYRLGRGNNSGISFDAPETSKSNEYLKNHPNVVKAIRKQALAIDKKNNFPLGTTTIQDVFKEGDREQEKFSNFVFDNTDEDGNITIEKFGKGHFGGTLFDVIGKDGKSYIQQNNNPESNLGYDSKYNKTQQKIDRLKQKELELKKTKFKEENALIPDNENIVNRTANVGLSGLVTGSNFIGDIVKTPFDLIDKGINKTYEKTNDRELYDSIIKKEKRKEYLEDNLEKYSSKENPTKKDLSIIKRLKGSLDKEDFSLTKEENKFDNSVKGLDFKLQDASKWFVDFIDEGKKLLNSKVNSGDKEQLIKDFKSDNAESVGQGVLALKQLSEGKYLKGLGNAIASNAKFIGSTLDSVSKNPLGVSQIAAESFVQSKALVSKGIVGTAAFLTTTKTQYDENLKDFKTSHNGEDPTDNQNALLLGGSLLSTYFGKVGAEVVFKPKAFRELGIKGQQKLFNKSPKLLQNTIKELAKVNKVTPIQMFGLLSTHTAKSMLAEGTTGAGESIINQLVSTGIVDPTKVALEAQLEAGGGLGQGAGVIGINALINRSDFKAVKRKYSGNIKIVSDAANKVGIPEDIALMTVNFESGFDSEARPIKDGKKLSSAHGFGQFLDGTWKDVIAKHGSKHGIVNADKLSTRQLNKLRSNKKLQALMFAEHTKDNIALGKKFGGKDDVANVYAFHNLGKAGATRFFKGYKKDLNKKVSEVLTTQEIKNNPSLYGNGSITLKEAYANMGDLLRNKPIKVVKGSPEFNKIKKKNLNTIREKAPNAYNFITNKDKSNIEDAVSETATLFETIPDITTGESKYNKVDKVHTVDEVTTVFNMAKDAYNQGIKKGLTEKEAFQQVEDSTIFDSLELNEAITINESKVLKGQEALDFKLSEKYIKTVKRDTNKLVNELVSHSAEAIKNLESIEDLKERKIAKEKIDKSVSMISLLNSVKEETALKDIVLTEKDIPKDELQEKTNNVISESSKYSTKITLKTKNERNKAYEKAIKFVQNTGKAETEDIYNHLNISYLEADRIIERLETNKIISLGKVGKKRKVFSFINRDELQEKINNATNAVITRGASKPVIDKIVEKASSLPVETQTIVNKAVAYNTAKEAYMETTGQNIVSNPVIISNNPSIGDLIGSIVYASTNNDTETVSKNIGQLKELYTAEELQKVTTASNSNDLVKQKMFETALDLVDSISNNMNDNVQTTNTPLSDSVPVKAKESDTILLKEESPQKKEKVIPSEGYKSLVKNYLKEQPHFIDSPELNKTKHPKNPTERISIVKNVTDAFRKTKGNSIFSKGTNSFESLHDDNGKEVLFNTLEIKDKNLKVEAKDSLDKVLGFTLEFNETAKNVLYKIKDFEVKETLIQKPIDLFKNDQRELPTNMYNATSVVVQDFIINKGVDTLNRSRDQVGKVLGYSNSDLELDVVSTLAEDVLSNIGIPFDVLVSELGIKITQQLAIELQEDTDGLLLEKLQHNLGTLAIATLSEMGIVDVNTLTNKEFKKLSPKDEVLNENAIQKYVALATVKNKNGTYKKDKYSNVETTELVKEYQERLKNINTISPILFGLKLGTQSISNKPIIKVPTNIKGKVAELTPLQQEANLAKQKQKIIPLKERFDLLRKINSKSTFLKIQGFIEPTGTQDNPFPEYHISKIKGIEGKNRTLVKEFDAMVEHMSSRKGDYITPFYLPYNVISNGRSMDTSDSITLQRSKMHRYMYGLNTFTIEVDSTNEEQFDQFLYTIRQTLGQDSINEDLEVSKELQPLIDLINSDKEKFSKKENKLFEELIGSAHEFAAIQDLALYKSSEGNPFTVSITGEADGITNGMITANLQLLPDVTKTTIDFLRRGGLFTEGSHTSYQEFMDQGNIDNYQNLTGKINDYVNALEDVDMNQNGLNNILPNFWDKRGVITKEGRDFGKAFFMTIAYGAGFKSSYDKLTAVTIDEIVDRLEKNDNLEGLNKGLTKVLKRKVNITEKNRLSFELTQEDKKVLHKVLQDTYGKGIKGAITEILGDFIENRNLMTSLINSNQLISSVLFEEKLTKKVKELGRRLSKKEKNDLIIEFRDTDDMYNVYSTSESTSNKDALDLSKLEKKNIKEKEGTTSSKFNTSLKTNNISIINNKVVSKENSLKTISSKVKELTIASSVGQAFPIINIMIDSIIAAKRTIDRATNGLDVFDDNIEGSNTVKDSTEKYNKDFIEVNQAFSVVDSVVERTIKQFEHISKTDRATQIKLRNQLFNTLPEDLYQEFNDLNNQPYKNLSSKEEKRLKTLKDDPRSKGDLKDNNYRVFRNSKEALIYALDKQTEITGNRENYFKQLTLINQFVNNEAKYEMPVKKDKSNSNTKGSSQNTVDKSLFEVSEAIELTPKSFEENFNGLAKESRKTDSESHRTHLKSIIHKLINPLLSNNKKITLQIAEGTGETKAQIDNYKEVYVEKGKRTQQHLFEISDQEALIHEVLHPILGANNNTKIKREFTRIRNITRNHLEKKAKEAGNKSFNNIRQYIAEELFIKKDKEGNPLYLTDEVLEKKEALKFVDYVLYDNIEEFVVHGIANERFNEILKEITVKNTNLTDEFKKAGTLKEKLNAILVALLDWYGQRKYTNTTKGNQALVKMMVEINEANVRRTSILRKATNHMNVAIRTKIVDKMVEPYMEWANANVLQTHSSNRFIKATSNIASLPAWIASPEWRNKFNSHQIEAIKRKDNFLHSTIREILIDSEKNKPFIKSLRYSKGVLEHKVEKTSEIFTKLVDDSFDQENKPNSDEYQAINSALLETAFYKLVESGWVPTDLEKILQDFGFLESAIENRIKNIKDKFDPELASYYVAETHSLGYRMATGQSNKFLGMANASLIANRKNLSQEQINLDGVIFDSEMNREEDIKFIEELAVLYSLKNTSMHNKSITAKFLKSERLRNVEVSGMQQLMRLQKLHDDVSLEKNFDGDLTQTILGYTTERYDSAIEMRIGTLLDEEIFKRDRFIRQEEAIPRDPNDPNQTEQYIYLNKDSLKRANLAGAVVLNDLKNRGQSLKDQVKNGSLSDFIRADEVRDNYLNNVQHKVFNENNKNINYLEPIFGDNTPITIDKEDIKSQIRHLRRERQAIKNTVNTQRRSITERQEQGIKNYDRHIEELKKSLRKGEEGQSNVVGFKYVMHKHNKTKLLGKSDKAHITMGRMFANIELKKSAPELNKIIVAQLKADFNQYYKNDPSEYVEVSSKSEDPRLQEIYATLPKAMKDHINKTFKGNNLFIRRELLDIVFGYRDPSISAWIDEVGKKHINNDNDPRLKTIIRDKENLNKEYLEKDNIELLPLYQEKLAKLEAKEKKILAQKGVNPAIIKMITLMENMWSTLVKTAKRVIVILIPAVIIGNTISNFISGIYNGMSVKDNVKWTTEGLTELFSYQKANKEYLTLKAKLDSNKNIKNRDRLEVKLQDLKDSIESNLVHELVQNGIYQTIVEDIDIDKGNPLLTTVGSFGSIGESIEKNFNKGAEAIPKRLIDVGKQILISPDTTLGKSLLNATQYSDFIARYSLHKHNMKNTNLTKEESINKILEVFVSYTDPTSKPLQWANNMGLMMFTKFMLRVQKPLAKAVYNNPADVISVAVMEQLLGDIPEITDSVLTPSYLWNHVHFPMDGQVEDNLLQPNLLKYIGLMD